MSPQTFSEYNHEVECATTQPRPLRVLIVKPRPDIRQIRAEGIMRCEPLELEYLYTVLSQHEVTLLDGTMDRRSPVAVARSLKPDVLLFTAYISDVATVLVNASAIKLLPNPPLIFVGGVHAEVLPEHFDDQSIDGVFFAQQLAGILTTLNAIHRQMPYHDTIGAAFRQQGKLNFNPCAAPELHELPLPRRVLFEKRPAAYRYLHYRKCASVKTSFGCPGYCTFCFCCLMNGGQYTTRSLHEVLDEIEALPAAETIFLVDDNFLVDTIRLNEFCEQVQARGIDKQFIAYGTSRFIAQHPEVIKRLREIGLRGLIVGFEFISDTELGQVKKATSRTDHDATVALCQQLEIDLFALFMLNPQWHPQQFRQMAAYCRQQQLTFATFATLTPFPGTPLTRATATGTTPAGTDWWRYDLLRLHEKPKFMPYWRYYGWLYYLYLLPALSPATLKRLIHRCGWRETLRLIAASTLTGAEYLVKLFIWK